MSMSVYQQALRVPGGLEPLAFPEGPREQMKLQGDYLAFCQLARPRSDVPFSHRPTDRCAGCEPENARC